MGFFDRLKKGKKKEEEELDILEELKEPFSLDRFLEEQVVERYQSFRKVLEEKGILFFLLSPFQYKNRLLLKLAVVFFGVLLGVIPRSLSLVNQAKERNAASELAQIADREFTIGQMKIKALASSQYDRQHLLTFLIEGETSAGVPSTIERYDVELYPVRGVADAESVRYSYDILPIDNSQRMLMIYVDNREQNDDTGIFGLTVQIKDDEVSGENVLEIVLSDSQETTTLFDKNGIDLAILTDKFIEGSRESIEDSEKELTDALSGYELMVDRLVVDGYTVPTDSQAMNQYVDDYMILKGLTDDSTVRNLPDDAEKMEELTEDQEEVKIEIVSELLIGDREYRTNDEDSDVGRADYDTTDQQAVLELAELQAQASRVTTALTKLNDIRQEKYDTLVDWQRILNREIKPEEFSMQAKVSEQVYEEGVIRDDVEHEIIDPREDIKVDPSKEVIDSNESSDEGDVSDEE